MLCAGVSHGRGQVIYSLIPMIYSLPHVVRLFFVLSSADFPNPTIFLQSFPQNTLNFVRLKEKMLLIC